MSEEYKKPQPPRWAKIAMDIFAVVAYIGIGVVFYLKELA